MKLRLTQADIEKLVYHAGYYVFPGTTTTVCCLTLLDGFNSVGSSACLDEGSFDPEIGRKVAYDNALSKVWDLEGYLQNWKNKRGMLAPDAAPAPAVEAVVKGVAEPVVEPVVEVVAEPAVTAETAPEPDQG